MFDETNFDKVIYFHLAFEMTVNYTPTVISMSEATLRYTLMQEELAEVDQAMADVSPDGQGLPQLAKELADLLYVVYGTAVAYGIDIDRVFTEVHKSNMSKLGRDGRPVYREDGKVLKGPDYQPPNLEWVK